MNEISAFALLCVSSFLTLVNPLNVLPVFMTMTGSLETRERNRIAKRASITAFFTMLFFAFFGQVAFKLLGISVNGLRIVGSILFMTVGYDMLQAKGVRTKPKAKEVGTADEDNDISITPLAIPIIAGPGAITNSIVLMEDATGFAKKVVLIVTMILINVLMFYSLKASNKINKTLGSTGNRVLTRLMGLIIMVIAVEFFFAGVKPFLQDIFMLENTQLNIPNIEEMQIGTDSTLQDVKNLKTE